MMTGLTLFGLFCIAGYNTRRTVSAVWRRLRCWFGFHRWRPLPSFIGPSVLVCFDCHRFDVEEM